MIGIDAAEVALRVEAVKHRLDRVGGSAVTVVAVTKTFGPEAIDAVVSCGLVDIGENYAQETVAKLPDVVTSPTVHFIGQLQRNKVRMLAPWVDVWQSVDRSSLALEIAKRAPGSQVMVQVDISGEQHKGGCEPADVESLVATCADAGLDVVGLMGVALLAEPEAARPGFRLLRRLTDQLVLAHCSMGMSADLEIAVDEGATMVRIGRDLFGARPLSADRG